MTGMKYLLLFLGISTVIFIISACKTKKGVPAEPINEPVISLSKGRCFGKCKVYRLDIYADQSATYTGFKNVERIGDFKGQIDNEDYHTLNDMFKIQHFGDLEKEYLSGARDLQRITMRHGKHSVSFHLRKAPENLKSIVRYIDDLIERLEWMPKEG